MPNAASRAASPEAKRIKSARTRNLTTAKRSLSLIIPELTAQQAALEKGVVPDGLPEASLAKYTQAIWALRLVESITGEPGAGEPAAEDGDEPEGARPEDIALLVQVVANLGNTSLANAGPDTPLGRLIRVAFPGEFPAPGTSALSPSSMAPPDGAASVAAPAGAPPAPQPPLSGDAPYDPARESPAQYGARRAAAVIAAVEGSQPQPPVPAGTGG